MHHITFCRLLGRLCLPVRNLFMEQPGLAKSDAQSCSDVTHKTVNAGCWGAQHEKVLGGV
jgi:hypothetical protein